ISPQFDDGRISRIVPLPGRQAEPLRLTTSIVLPRDGLRSSSPQTFAMLAALRPLLTTYPDILRHSTLPACGYCCAIVTGSRAMLLTWCAPQGIERCRVPPERNSDPLVDRRHRRRKGDQHTFMKVLLQTCAVVAVPLLLVSCSGANAAVPASPPIYNPYPSGILPADVESETARVQGEVQGIFQQALIEANALPPANVTGQPPTQQGSGYQAVQTLGKLMNYDVNMSSLKNIACASCHMPYVGFGGPIPSVNLTMIAYPGTYHFRAGKRTPQRYTYSPYFPVLQYNESQELFFGGNFWDSRATGYLLQSPDAEQAQHPPVDSQEMGLPDTACIAWRLSQSQYVAVFERVWGAGSLSGIAWPSNTEQICSTPAGAAIFGTNTQPVNLSPPDRNRANVIFDHFGQSLSAYEKSNQVSPFSSKFDAFLKGNYTMTADEQAGYALFRGKGNCNSC